VRKPGTQKFSDLKTVQQFSTADGCSSDLGYDYTGCMIRCNGSLGKGSACSQGQRHRGHHRVTSSGYVINLAGYGGDMSHLAAVGNEAHAFFAAGHEHRSTINRAKQLAPRSYKRSLVDDLDARGFRRFLIVWSDHCDRLIGGEAPDFRIDTTSNL